MDTVVNSIIKHGCAAIKCSSLPSQRYLEGSCHSSVILQVLHLIRDTSCQNRYLVRLKRYPHFIPCLNFKVVPFARIQNNLCLVEKISDTRLQTYKDLDIFSLIVENLVVEDRDSSIGWAGRPIETYLLVGCGCGIII